METQVRTPQMVFMMPQRLMVPLFQRPYVWNQANQWEPLWDDVARLADRLLDRPQDKQPPHFLGAVVLQQLPNPVGLMQQRTVIDGQQRLTTLQLLMDALHAELVSVSASSAAARVEQLVRNSEHFCSKPEDRFKVWPTNRDRAAFNAVMGAEPPVDYDAIGHTGERMVEAHRFFSDRARKWLQGAGAERAVTRAAAIETVVRELLQLVVIDLGADENAQEIFETLNARGAQLNAADLIKNFVFQRLLESGSNVEAVYDQKWKDFETGFWEAEVGAGRQKHARSSMFLNHWLVARTGKEVLAREVFTRFKQFANDEADAPMIDVIAQVHRASHLYRDFIEKADTAIGPIDRLGLFAYRTSVLESEVVKPFVICLMDPEQQEVPEVQRRKALDVVESWMVRRMLVRVTTKNYNQVVAELVEKIRGSARATAGDVVEQFFAKQTTESRYWPDDGGLRRELQALLAYRRIGRGRLRMVLEAIEDYKRGWQGDRVALSGDRVSRGRNAIEHIMPRKWVTHWPLSASAGTEAERDSLVHTLGNLTLLPGRLNSKVSNGAWSGSAGKRAALIGHDTLFLNRDLREVAGDWNDGLIRQRTTELIEIIIKIWPVPPGHKTAFATANVSPRRQRVDLADLISAGLLHAGMRLYRRSKKTPEAVATLLADGSIEVSGQRFKRPSEAAGTITGHSTNGWWFFLVQQSPRRSLMDVWRDYVETLSVEPSDDDSAAEEEDEES